MQLLEHVPVIDNAGPANTLMFRLNREELALVVGAIEVVRREIDHEEFHARLGVDPADADALLSLLGAAGSEEPEDGPLSDPGPVPLTADQLVLVNNALNETVNGLAPEEVPPGLRGAEAAALLDAVHGILDGEIVAVRNGTGADRRYVDHLR